MTRKKLIKDIIRNYYKSSSDRNSEDDATIRKLFEQWIVSSEDSKVKEAVLKELWDKEKVDSSTMSPERVHAMIQRMDLTLEMSQKNKTEQNKEVQYSPKKKSHASLARWTLRMAAALIPAALIICGVLFLRPAAINSMEYVAARGEIETCDLEDGSVVTMNSDSKLSFLQSKNNRTANLSGEAYFNVARDEACPFVIKAERLTITVLGTKFNVEAYDDYQYSVVRVTDGKVCVEAPNNEKWTLVKGDKLSFDNATGLGEITNFETEAERVSWMNGWIVCETMTLPEIFKTIERKLDIDINLDAATMLPKTRYSVIIPEDMALNEILDVLYTTSGGFSYEINDANVKITTPQ